MIHPGDVQAVRAIGKPPPGSPFEKEPLPNAVVFSIKGITSFLRCVACTLKEYRTGDRPIPSKAGGGDLDGDVVSDLTFNTPTYCSLKNPVQYRFDT